MKRVARLLCACVLLLLAAGCAHPPLRVDLPELKMMPPEVALKLAKRHLPSADSYGFMGSKVNICGGEANVWITYPELTRAAYAEKHYVMSMVSDGFCYVGIRVPYLSPDEAAELAAAVNALGAKIRSVAAL